MVAKKLKIIFGLGFVIVLGFLVSTQVAKAYGHIGWYWGEPTKLAFYVAASTHQNDNAAYAKHGGLAWNPSAKVQIAESASSTHNGRLTHIVTTTTDIGKFYARAETFKSDDSACEPGWYCKAYKGKVTINNPRFKGLSPSRKYETVTHEMGHIVGLAHEDSIRPAIMISGSEMTGGWCDCTAPQDDDYRGLLYLYQ